jgi:hypothetical protein
MSYAVQHRQSGPHVLIGLIEQTLIGVIEPLRMKLPGGKWTIINCHDRCGDSGRVRHSGVSLCPLSSNGAEVVSAVSDSADCRFI